MLKKIYEFIDYDVRDNYLFPFITFLICGILGFALMFFCVVDSTPATKVDYAPLIEQNSVIQEDFNKVYNYDNYEILPSENNIKVTFSNDQCKLACTYDKNFKFIKDKKIDLAESKGYNIKSNYNDCGVLIFDKEKQDTHSGGSGCGCIASVFSGYIFTPSIVLSIIFINSSSSATLYQKLSALVFFARKR